VVRGSGGGFLREGEVGITGVETSFDARFLSGLGRSKEKGRNAIVSPELEEERRR